jgi:hypothetical protein
LKKPARDVLHEAEDAPPTWFLSNSQGLLGDAPIDDFMPPRDGTRRACHVTGPG